MCCIFRSKLSCSETGTGRKVAKFFLFISNVIFLVTGLSIFGVGLTFLLLQKTVLSLVPVHVALWAGPLVISGCVLCILAIFGCVSSWTVSRILLVVYCTCLVALITVQSCLVSVTWGRTHQAQELTETWIRDTFNKTDLREHFQLLEVLFQCCGTDGPKSYYALNKSLPPTCCARPQPVAFGVLMACAAQHSYPGCAAPVAGHIQTLVNVGSFTITYTIAVEILALLASWYLFRASSVIQPVYHTVNTTNEDDHPYRQCSYEMDQLIGSNNTVITRPPQGRRYLTKDIQED